MSGAHSVTCVRAFAAFAGWAMVECILLQDAARGQHAGDILIGMSSVNQLVVAALPTRPLTLPPVSSGPFFGWASNTLGFDGVVDAEPLEDLFPVGAGAHIYLEVVSIDAGLSLRSFTAFTSVFADEPGERLRIGVTGSLHWHPIAFIDGGVVGSSFWGLKTAQVKLVDVGDAGLEESLPFELAFSVARRPTGDFNTDGVVDGSDFLAWQRSLGSMGDDIAGDGNYDGVVDGADLAVWKSQFGLNASAVAQSQSVPEPESLGLSAAVLLAIAGARERRQRGFRRSAACI